MQLIPSDSVFTKRKFLNYLIAFESILLIGLTGLAIKVRHVGEALSYKNDLKEYLLLVSFPIIWLCCLSIFGAWDLTILDNHIDGYRRLLRSSFMTFLAFSSASYLFKIQISRFVILFSLVGGTILHLILRWTFLRLVDKKIKRTNWKEHWLVLGSSLFQTTLVDEFAKRESAELHHLESVKAGLDFSKWVDEVVFQIAFQNCTKVLLTSPDMLEALQIQHLMWAVQQTGSEFLTYDNLGLTKAQSQIRYSEDYNWVSIGTHQISDSLRVLKRIFDLVIVIPFIILLIPVYLIISSLILCESRGGGVLYFQKRIGQNGILFNFPKFRSMYAGSDKNRLMILGRPDEGMAERYRTDPRITRVGRLLRRFSLDELPQLWCVFKGNMSLVGPRPILPDEAPQLGDFNFRRHIAKPGLTGIWQVSGRKETTWEERMAFDIQYLQQWSIALDLILIFRTVRAVIDGKGSY